jgi:hypothetical protein
VMHGLRTQHPQAWAPSSAPDEASTIRAGVWCGPAKARKKWHTGAPAPHARGITARTLRQLANPARQRPEPALPDTTNSYQKNAR